MKIVELDEKEMMNIDGGWGLGFRGIYGFDIRYRENQYFGHAHDDFSWWK